MFDGQTMIRINDIIDKVTEHQPGADTDLIDRAYIFSAKVHEGQNRLSGEPYLSHPLEVAYILADMNLDVVSVAAGLLHDVIEDTHTSEEDIEQVFGKDVLHIVNGVTKMSKVSYNSAQARQAESIKRMLLAMADDIRVILIKLADRLHNMRTLQYHKSNKRRKIARETLEIYAPIAARLGIYWIKKELEDSSFKYLEPEEHERLERWLIEDRAERENYITSVKDIIQSKLDEAHLPGEVFGRYKHFYSIHQKMLTQNLPFEEIYDIIAFRIILDTITQCYEALGLLHSMWKPIAHKFKDYIGMPKPNMYQSLHTTVVGPKGERIEIQIRTQEMDRIAESGIAAHWSYKEGHNVDEKMSNKFAWIQNLVEAQEELRDPEEFLENVRIDLFPDEVYVFTPQGEIKSLPKGATPVDFAYAIHTEVGNQCIGAKVDGRMVPLKHKLQTGHIVEIVTNKGHHPSKDWLGFVKTAQARSKIRQWIKQQEKERSLTLGREMCEKEFRKYRLNFNTLLKTEEMDKAVVHFGFKTIDDMIASVGYGKLTPLQIIGRLRPKAESAEDGESVLNKLIGRARRKKAKAGIIVKGLDDILVRFGKCCSPVPGDDIIGYITRGQGVTIHRINCVNVLTLSPERKIDVQWTREKTTTYPVKIRVRSLDRVGLLADVATSISKNGANILSANTETHEDQTVDTYFALGVADTRQLNKVLADIRKVKLVQDVQRVG